MSGTEAEFSSGWRVLAAGVLGMSVGISSLYSYALGVLLRAMGAAFGWGRGAASLGALIRVWRSAASASRRRAR